MTFPVLIDLSLPVEVCHVGKQKVIYELSEIEEEGVCVKVSWNVSNCTLGGQRSVSAAVK